MILNPLQCATKAAFLIPSIISETQCPIRRHSKGNTLVATLERATCKPICILQTPADRTIMNCIITPSTMTTHRISVLLLAACSIALWCVSPMAVMGQQDRPLRPRSTPLTPTPKQPTPPDTTSPPQTPPPVNPMLDPNPPPANVPTRPGTGALINLRPKFTKGQVIKFKMNMTSSGTQNLPSIDRGQPLQPLKQSMSQEIGLSLKVTETTPNENTKADLVYDTVKLSMTTPDGSKVEFDSTKPPAGDADPIAMMLKSLVGLSMTLTIDKDGNITSVDSSSSPLADAGMLKAFTGADVVKNLFGPITTTSKSNGEARVGESWTNEDQIDAPWGKMRLALGK